MKYRIIDISDNNGGSDGHVIIVKANVGKKSPGFDHLSKMFGKEYYTFSLMDDSETEIFVFPFSEELVNSLVNQARLADTKQKYWEPADDEFYDAQLMEIDGSIKNIHKHISFKMPERICGGIQDIIQSFSFRNDLGQLYKDESKLSEVKNVQLAEGAIYSGKALQIGEACIPCGYGVKFYKERKTKIASFYRMGKVSTIGLFFYPNYMYIGGVIEESPNGWGFKLAKGQFTFGFYKDGYLYKDLSPFATDVFYRMRRIGTSFEHIYGKVNRLIYGVSKDNYFLGVQFFEDGSVFLGEGNGKNDYLTGNYLHFEIDGKAECGNFKDGVLVEEMSPLDFYGRFTTKNAGIEKIDLSKDYLSIPDSGLFLIIAIQHIYDLDIGQVVSVKTIPYELLSYDGEISFNIKDAEYFYLKPDDNIVEAMKMKAGLNLLWKVNLDDFHTYYGYAYDLSEENSSEKNIHLHNSLVELNYSSVTDFDNINVVQRLKTEKLHTIGSIQTPEYDEDDIDDLPF